MQVQKHHHRQRSATDPFSDPTTISYVPALPRSSPLTTQPYQRRAAPPPPPKPSDKPHSKRPYTAPGNQQNMTDAVRDVVTIRGGDQPRTRLGRSQTDLPPPSNLRNVTTPAAPGISKRSQSQDSVVRAANSMEKAKSTRRTGGAKKGSSHADVIDRLDFSGVGPMFHHDGPFDACAPSRNRHRTKAPMLAWSAASEADRAAFQNAKEIETPGRSYDSPYPSPAIYAPYEAPKKKHDAIAEAWGIHEPEPFEDFSAGGGANGGRPSVDYPSARSNGKEPARRTKDGRDARDVYREYLDEQHPTAPRRAPTTKRALPPPQPIFVPESELDGPPSPTLGSPPASGTPKRTKSLMHRIRKMRDSPNVPVGVSEEDGYHRDQSPAGRNRRAYNGNGNGEDAFVYVETVPVQKDKSLPDTPQKDAAAAENSGYFDQSEMGVGHNGAGLGRKTSLMKKMFNKGAAK